MVSRSLKATASGRTEGFGDGLGFRVEGSLTSYFRSSVLKWLVKGFIF